MTRLEILQSVFENVDEDKKAIVEPVIEEVVFLENRLQDLKKLPHIRVHPKNSQRQEQTAAGKMYKETMQTYLNAIKVLQITAGRYAVEEQDAFDEWLQQNS